MMLPFFLPRAVIVASAVVVAAVGAVSRLAAAGTVIVTVKDNKGAPVSDAAVYLTPLDQPPVVTAPPEPLVVSQQGQEFEPYVTIVVVGSSVSFPNRDNIRHQVYSLSKAKPFEIPLSGPGTSQAIRFDQPGIVAIGCNIHDHMSAYVVVVSTPHFLKTATDGLARFGDLAPGRYRLDVWHPRLAGETRRDLVIAANDAATQTISVTLKPDKRIRRAPDGSGGGYK